MRKLIIDMDDVMCKNGFIRIVNEFLGTNYKAEDANSYYINDLIPKEKMKEWIKYFETINVYDYVDLIEDVKNVMKKLNEKYELYIVTAFIFRDEPKISGRVLEDKFNYLYEEFPFIAPEQYVFSCNKDIIDADVRIDDSLGKLEGKAKIKLLFTAYHNGDISKEELDSKGVIRVNSWKEIENILL